MLLEFSVPRSVRESARKGLLLRDALGRGGTHVGLRTAQRLSLNKQVSYGFVRKVSQYFPRHQYDRLDDPTSNGTIAWLLWGGDAGWKWSIVDRIEKR